MRVLIIIPAYNEEESIDLVIRRIKQIKDDIDYIIINDGSRDDTKKKCIENNYNFVDLPVNLGLDGAVRAGFKYGKSKKYDYVIQIDGDGQHNPEYIAGMVELAERNNCDIVIGSRFLTEKKPWTIRMFGSRIVSILIRITTGDIIKDPTSGMRLYGKRAIKVLADNAYPPEPDTIAYLISRGFRVDEYQVSMSDRLAGESYLNITNSIKYMLKMISSILIVNRFRGGVD